MATMAIPPEASIVHCFLVLLLKIRLLKLRQCHSNRQKTRVLPSAARKKPQTHHTATATSMSRKTTHHTKFTSHQNKYHTKTNVANATGHWPSIRTLTAGINIRNMSEIGSIGSQSERVVYGVSHANLGC